MTLGVAIFRFALIPFLTHPGYTDAHYYFLTARRLAAGEGLITDFIWNFVEAPNFASLPVPSHRFWMPLATAIQTSGIVAFGSVLDALRSAQLAVALVAIAIAPATYLLARRLGAGQRLAALAALVAGLGAVDAVAWSSLDNFAPLAVLGTLLFATLPGVAAGRLREILVAGAALGGIVLARADGPLYALAPLLLARRAPRAALAVLALGALVALPWYARNAVLAPVDAPFARAALLVRYEDFFSLEAPRLESFIRSLDVVLAAKWDALPTDLGVFILSTGIVLGPLALFAAWRRRADPAAAGWLVVTLGVFVAQWLVFTLHSTRGSLSHSLAGVVPGAIALGLLQASGLARTTARPAAFAVAAATLALSVLGVAQWKSAFDPVEGERRARVSRGDVLTPVFAADAASWRYFVDGPVLMTPPEGLAVLRNAARRYGARTLVLESGHFAAYDRLYDGLDRVEWLEPLGVEESTKVWRIRE